MNKKCRDCGEIKTTDDFYFIKKASGKIYYYPNCKACFKFRRYGTEKKVIERESIDEGRLKQPPIPHQEFCSGCPIYADRTTNWGYSLCYFWGDCGTYGKIKEIIQE